MTKTPEGTAIDNRATGTLSISMVCPHTTLPQTGKKSVSLAAAGLGQVLDPARAPCPKAADTTGAQMQQPAALADRILEETQLSQTRNLNPAVPMPEQRPTSIPAAQLLQQHLFSQLGHKTDETGCPERIRKITAQSRENELPISLKYTPDPFASIDHLAPT